MSVILVILSLGLLVVLAVFFLKNRNLTRLVRQRQAEVAAAEQQTVQVRKQCEAETIRLRKEVAAAKQQTIQAGKQYEAETIRLRKNAEQAVTEAQKLIDRQIAQMQSEAQRVRQHYEGEARKVTDVSRAQLAKALKEVEELRKYAPLRDAEDEVRRVLAEAMTEATALRGQAQTLLEQARTAAEGERLRATERAKLIYEQADARLNQATRDAGRVVADAEKRAKEVAGEAHDALRDKQLLERAAEAMRNIIEGYGDRYVVPTHSLLDDLAVEFGYTSAGESLKSARAQSRRMVEQGEAATCEYVEASRRDTAVRFVIDAFNGRVDGILSRVKYDNYGVLEQEIRDSFSLVNLNGKAFRDARILPAYLDARLAELKWAVVVQELARQRLEEQRDHKARQRDEAKAREEREEKERQAAKDEELKRAAFAAAEQHFAQATAEDKARTQAELEDARRQLAEATEKRLTIAQQTKKGSVYIISNIGSFGEGVYKIGHTLRHPQVRVDELGDASVPFGFDIHAVIKSDNAQALEHKLQKRFLNMQVNKKNSRKEFFRVTLKDIREEVDKLKEGEDFTVTLWTDMAVATQYRESLDIESDPEKLEKWLKRQEGLADRDLRLDALRLSPTDITEPDTEETNR